MVRFGKCSICQGSFSGPPPGSENDKVVVIRRCGHVFHDECVLGIPSGSRYPLCPVCKTSFSNFQDCRLLQWDWDVVPEAGIEAEQRLERQEQELTNLRLQLEEANAKNANLETKLEEVRRNNDDLKHELETLRSRDFSPISIVQNGFGVRKCHNCDSGLHSIYNCPHPPLIRPMLSIKTTWTNFEPEQTLVPVYSVKSRYTAGHIVKKIMQTIQPESFSVYDVQAAFAWLYFENVCWYCGSIFHENWSCPFDKKDRVVDNKMMHQLYELLGHSKMAPQTPRPLPSQSQPAAAALAGGTPQDNGTSPMNIDEGLYSGQIYVLGKNAMTWMASSNVLIAGLGGLGVRIAKNVILDGVRSVTLQDSKDTTWWDLTSQFYLKKADLGKNRAAQSHQQLSELNPYVSVSVSTDPLTVDYVGSNNFKVVVLTEGCESVGGNNEAMENLLQYCHDNGIYVILAETRGLFARVFCDFGKGFTVVDTNGENPVSATIADVTKEEKGLATCLDEARHGLEDGDYVRFNEVQGMEELNQLEPVKIEVTRPYNFRICQDTRGFADYIRGGNVTQVKMPKQIDFKSYKESRTNPDFLITDFAKTERSDTLNVGFQALDTYITRTNGGLPRPWNEEDANTLQQIAEEIAAEYEMTLDKKVLRLFSYIAQGQVCPMNGFIGGVVAQEVMKACSGTFMPIFQYIFFEAVECFSEETQGNLEDDGKFKVAVDEGKYEAEACRDDAQVAVFRRQLQDTLGNLKYFIVGAEAIVEMVKSPKPEDAKGTKEIRADFESIARPSVSSSVVEKPPPPRKVMPKTPEKVIKKTTPEKVVEKPAKALERKPVQSVVKSWMNMSYSPNLKSGYLVNVVFAWSVLNYQVITVEDMEKLEHFQEKLAKYVVDGKLAKFNREPQKDKTVIAEYEGAYYRARVMATGSSDSSAQISFVDYGDRTIASYGDLLEITDKMLKTPVYGLKLRLDGVSSQDVSMSTKLSEDIEAKMYET